jgi:uncharacterized glyoxalase superfamily protein PhnB
MESRSTIGPVIWYRDPRAAIDWLETAFGFERRLVVEGDDGMIAHSELTLGDGYIMVVGPPREKAISPMQFGGRATQSVHVQLTDGVDEHYARARAATQPYGDRVYVCTDIEDHPWSFGQTVQVLSDDAVAEATGHTIRAGKGA